MDGKAQPRATAWCRLKHSLAEGIAGAFGRCLGPIDSQAVGILMYHRVADPIEGKPLPTWNVSPNRFERQLSGLLKREYEAWPLAEVLRHREEGKPIPPRVFVVTFDDCYETTYTRAFPILRALNIPATCFLATSYLDSSEPFPFDDWTARYDSDVPLDARRSLTTEQCREMAASGLIELGAHTHTHADFRNRPRALLHDLNKCVHELRERFGVVRPSFAFPYGTRSMGYSGPLLATAAREAGVSCSLTTEPTAARLADDPFDWGRFAAEESDTPFTLEGKLTGWYSRLRAAGLALTESCSFNANASRTTGDKLVSMRSGA